MFFLPQSRGRRFFGVEEVDDAAASSTSAATRASVAARDETASAQENRARVHRLVRGSNEPKGPLRRPLRVRFGMELIGKLSFSINRGPFFSSEGGRIFFSFSSTSSSSSSRNQTKNKARPLPSLRFLSLKAVSFLQCDTKFSFLKTSQNQKFQFFFPPNLTFSLIFGLAGDTAGGAVPAAPAPAGEGAEGVSACCAAAAAAVVAPSFLPLPAAVAAAGSSTAAALSSPVPSATSSPRSPSRRLHAPRSRIARDLVRGATASAGREPAGTEGAGFDASGARPVAAPRFQSLASPGTPTPPLPPPCASWLRRACSCCCATNVPLCVRSWRRRRL